MLGIFVVLLIGNSSRELNLIFIYFHHNRLSFFVIDLIKSLTLLHSSSYLLIFPLHSLVETSFKYLFLLISSKYRFTLLIITYKGFTLLIFTYFESLIVTYPISKEEYFCMTFHLFYFCLDQNFLY